MTLQNISPHLPMLDLTFHRVQAILTCEFRTYRPQSWSDDRETFMREHDITLKALARDGRRRSFPAFPDIALLPHHRFTLRQHLGEPAHRYKAMVYYVYSTHNDLIDLAAIVPSVNRAALFLGTRGVLGAHWFGYRGAKRGLRVYRDAMQYLRSGRNGILIVDPAKAAVELSGKLLLVDTTEHAFELARLGLDERAMIVRPQKNRG